MTIIRKTLLASALATAGFGTSMSAHAQNDPSSDIWFNTGPNVQSNGMAIIDDELVVGEAAAGQTSAEGADLNIRDGVPHLRFTDTTNATGNWILGTASGTPNFVIEDDDNARNILIVEDGALANQLVLESTGDVSLGQNSVYVDHSADRLGIGTITPNSNIHINSTGSPSFRMQGSGSNWQMLNGASGLWWYRTTPNVASGVLKLQNDAPANTLVLDNLGVAMGKGVASSALDIGGNSVGTNAANTTQIRIQNNSGTETFRNMLTLINNGDPRMIYTNTATGDTWSENPIGPAFRISKNGSGVFEMSIFTGGNVTIGGTLTEGSDRNIKTGFEDLSANDVLAKINALPVTEWSYKHAPEQRHVGPMAQDFYAAFGLGTDDKHLSPRDLASVSVVAIQAQQKVIDELKTDKVQQAQKLSAQEAKIDDLVKELTAMREGMAELKAVVENAGFKQPKPIQAAF